MKKENKHQEGLWVPFFPNTPQIEKISFADSMDSCQGPVLLEAAATRKW